MRGVRTDLPATHGFFQQHNNVSSLAAAGFKTLCPPQQYALNKRKPSVHKNTKMETGIWQLIFKFRADVKVETSQKSRNKLWKGDSGEVKRSLLNWWNNNIIDIGNARSSNIAAGLTWCWPGLQTWGCGRRPWKLLLSSCFELLIVFFSQKCWTDSLEPNVGGWGVKWPDRLRSDQPGWGGREVRMRWLDVFIRGLSTHREAAVSKIFRNEGGERRLHFWKWC